MVTSQKFVIDLRLWVVLRCGKKGLGLWTKKVLPYVCRRYYVCGWFYVCGKIGFMLVGKFYVCGYFTFVGVTSATPTVFIRFQSNIIRALLTMVE